MTRIYAFVNQKGGVGKTTTAINLGSYLATNNQQVLLVDLDAQGNATACLGVERKNINAGTYNLLINPSTRLHANTMRSEKLGISLIPSSPALAGAEVELVNEPDRANRLKQALSQASRYDYVLIDCPPSLGLLTLNGLVAAQAVVVPVQCEYLALEGLGQLLETINRIQVAFNFDLQIRGVLMTMYDSRLKLSQQVVDEVRLHFPDKVFQVVIPRNVRLAEAPSHGQPISKYAPDSAGANAYAALATEILSGDTPHNIVLS
jgi:chromosome partitioning protein